MPQSPLVVARTLGRIQASGDLAGGSVHRLLAALHQAVEAGSDEVQLDLSDCTGAWTPPMLQLAVQVMAYRDAGKYVRLDLPRDQRLSRLFKNANWAHLIDPRTFDVSRFRGFSQMPATQYRTPTEQNAVVNRIVQTALAAARDCDRSEIRAFEWALNEVTDNVLVHASSRVGGLVQMNYSPQRGSVRFAVADAGVSIPATLRAAFPEIASDSEAIDRAMREGVTRDRSIGQGNGLFGTYEICNRGAGTFVIDSRFAYAVYKPSHGLHIRDQQVRYDGTLVAAEVDFSIPGLLEDALKISGETKRPIDFIETHYEAHDGKELVFDVKAEATSLGSRAAGEPLRRTLENLNRMARSMRIVIDFHDIPIVSSSFADEVVAKLFVALGPLGFMERFELRNVEPLVRELIDKAIKQRSKTA